MSDVKTHVWMRASPNRWMRITNVAMSFGSAETMAKALSYDHAVSSGDLRFCASNSSPRSFNWREDGRDAYFAGLFQISEETDVPYRKMNSELYKTLKHAVVFGRTVKSFAPDDHLYTLRALGFVLETGYPTPEGKEYVEKPE